MKLSAHWNEKMNKSLTPLHSIGKIYANMQPPCSEHAGSAGQSSDKTKMNYSWDLPVIHFTHQMKVVSEQVHVEF